MPADITLFRFYYVDIFPEEAINIVRISSVLVWKPQHPWNEDIAGDQGQLIVFHKLIL
jgi:hypothetical protein